MRWTAVAGVVVVEWPTWWLSEVWPRSAVLIAPWRLAVPPLPSNTPCSLHLARQPPS